jgi:hypothetical protein
VEFTTTLLAAPVPENARMDILNTYLSFKVPGVELEKFKPDPRREVKTLLGRIFKEGPLTLAKPKFEAKKDIWARYR